MAGYCKISEAWESIRKYFKKNNGQWNEISESDFSQYKNVTIKAGVGMTNFTIKEFRIERTNG